MKLATYKAAGHTSYGIVTDQGIVDLGKRIGGDLKSLLQKNSLQEARKHSGEKPDCKIEEVQ